MLSDRRFYFEQRFGRTAWIDMERLDRYGRSTPRGRGIDREAETTGEPITMGMVERRFAGQVVEPIATVASIRAQAQ